MAHEVLVAVIIYFVAILRDEMFSCLGATWGIMAVLSTGENSQGKWAATKGSCESAMRTRGASKNILVRRRIAGRALEST